MSEGLFIVSIFIGSISLYYFFMYMSRRQKKNNAVNITAEWDDDLIWCPSQCYLNLEYNGRYFVIYLRWRWEDPWQATLVECDEDYDMHNKKYEWQSLEVNYYRDSELDKIKNESIRLAKKKILNDLK